MRYRGGALDLLAPAPPWQEWNYPGSRVQSRSTGVRSQAGEIGFGSTQRLVLLTPDDFHMVWAFYQKKCKLPEPAVAHLEFIVETAGGPEGSRQPTTVTVSDEVQAEPLQGPQGAAVLARGFSVESLRYTLVGFVYRPREGESTCVLLVYRPHKEFIGLLKEKLIKE